MSYDVMFVHGKGDNPKSIGSILAVILRQMKRSGSKDIQRVTAAWEEITDSEVCRHATPVRFLSNVVTVHVDSAPWLHDLTLYYKEALLTDLRRALPTAYIRDLKFQQGPLSP